MKYSNVLLLLTIILVFGCKTVKTDSSQLCVHKEIQYLTTYIDSRMWKVAGGDMKMEISEIRELTSKLEGNPQSGLFFVPMVINGIREIYLDNDVDESELSFLVEFSGMLSVLWDDSSILISIEDSGAEVCKNVNSIVDYYHKSSEDDDEFYKMIFTLDDGPFYGEDVEYELEKIDEVMIDTYKLILRSNGVLNTLELLTEKGQVKWRKLIERSADYRIETVKFIDNPVMVSNNLGYKIGMYGDGELLHFYLRKNGDFRLFFHSW